MSNVGGNAVLLITKRFQSHILSSNPLSTLNCLLCLYIKSSEFKAFLIVIAEVCCNDEQQVRNYKTKLTITNCR